MKNRNIFEKLGDFVLGKGFYIVLFLCVATIGISGYYLIQTMTGDPQPVEQAGGSASVELPDDWSNASLPSGIQELEPNGVGQEQEESLHQESAGSSSAVAEQPDDPEPVSQTQEESAAPEQPVATVFTWPVKGEVLRDYSMEALALDPTLGDWRTHEGLDIAAQVGLEVLAIGAGTVTEVFEDGLMGTTVVIDHGNGLTSTYCNLATQPTVSVGETVEPGTILGAVGESAIAESGMASHLHLETCLNGERVNPMEYLPDLP
ncbi:MAG: peptidoglycan DD-metalloendopeptidase family protein [Lawsonibacter sp.]